MFLFDFFSIVAISKQGIAAEVVVKLYFTLNIITCPDIVQTRLEEVIIVSLFETGCNPDKFCICTYTAIVTTRQQLVLESITNNDNKP